MIKTFRDKPTALVFKGIIPKGLSPQLARVGRRKLRAVDAAIHLNDLRSPPGNHLEPLTKNRAGQHSIRINDQWRVCFVWKDGDAYEVEITDYH